MYNGKTNYEITKFSTHSIKKKVMSCSRRILPILEYVNATLETNFSASFN